MREYFGKELQTLTPAECASLISITNNPSLYNPYRSSLDAGGQTGLERNRKRQLDVLGQMLEQEWITQEEYDKWRYTYPEVKVQHTREALDALREAEKNKE